MGGRLIASCIVVAALAMGGAIYWLQVYGYYRELTPAEVTLTVTMAEGTTRPLAAASLQAIDADSSPIRFRACFTLADADALAETARPAPEPVPLVAPHWFDCFDAERIGNDLEMGRATAILGEENVVYGIDRVIALYRDGRAFAWDQINRCGREVFDGKPPPPGCPPPPG